MDVPLRAQQIPVPFNTTYVPFGMIRVIVKTFAIQIRQFLGAFDVFCLQWPDLEFQTMKFLILIKLCLEFQVYPGVLSSVHIRVFHTRQATYLLWKFARVFAALSQTGAIGAVRNVLPLPHEVGGDEGEGEHCMAFWQASS